MMVIALEAQRERLDREHNQRAWAVWHVAALSRSKKLPKIEQLMVRVQQRAAQTWQDMKSAFKAINAASGGVFRKKDKHGR
jgi:hypothetical protein